MRHQVAEVEEASEQLEACRKAREHQRTIEREQESREARIRLEQIESKMNSKKLLLSFLFKL